MGIGRPSTFSPAVGDEICERLSNGESLRSICGDDHMPNKSTVFRWLAAEANATFRDQYARAREAQADAIFDEILDIADTPELGEKRKTLPDGKEEVTYGDMIEHRRLRVDARKWMAGKLRPKVYGDKVQSEISGTGGGPIQFIIESTEGPPDGG